MVIAVFGESCTGKSTIAKLLQQQFSAEIYSGKDYLRLAKSPFEAETKFRSLLKQAQDSDSALIDVISEPEQLRLLPDGCFRVLVTAGLGSIQTRFAKRTGGVLPPPVAAMLECRHGCFDKEPHGLRIDTDTTAADDACRQILQALPHR